MLDRIPFRYGEFNDMPRMIDFEFRGEWFYLSSDFDSGRDDYSEFYNVYLLPYTSHEEFDANPHYWMDLSKASYLGQISIADVGLDETLRKSIDAHNFEEWLLTHRKPPAADIG